MDVSLSRRRAITTVLDHLFALNDHHLITQSGAWSIIEVPSAPQLGQFECTSLSS